MKATKKITIMLMAITIGTLAASAQSARGTSQRSDSKKTTATTTTRVHTNKPRSASSKTDTKTSRVNQSRESKRPDSKTQVNYRASNTKPRVTNGKSDPRVSSNHSRYSTQSRNNGRMESTSKTKNQRNSYSAPENANHRSKTFVDPRTSLNNNNGHTTKTHSNQSDNYKHNSNYGNNYSHNYYPHKKVKMYVHPVTYNNHYNVIYYPAHRDIIWTNNMHRFYIDIYPGYAWRYPIGYHIQTISAFEARYNIGEISRVYGRVYATWYNRESDDLLLFFGGEYPDQEFTLIIPGNIARRYSWRPEKYFLGQHVLASGLISSFEGKPEMLVKRKNQLDIY